MSKEQYKDIWVFAEQENETLSDTTFELLAKSHDIREKLGSNDKIVAVLLGNNVSHLADTLSAYGAEKVIIAENANLETYSSRPYAKVLKELAKKYMPSIFLFPASTNGRDVAPRVMCELRTGLTADAIDLGVNEDGLFVQTTPNFGGSILSHIAIPERRPQMVTVHPKVFVPFEPNNTLKAEITHEEISVEADKDYILVQSVPKQVSGRRIDACNVLVAGGQGIAKKEDFDMLEELAKLLNGELACSRPVVDNDWLPHEKQIGQSGTTVKPEFIINVAISGSVQYVAGMEKSKNIISINHHAAAPIFDVSHYGAVTDYQSLIPALIEEIRTRKTK